MTQEEKQTTAFAYDQFISLFIAMAGIIEGELSMDFGLVWKCKKNYRNILPDTHFTLGIDTNPGHIIAYRIPNYYWKLCNYATTLEELPNDLEEKSHSDTINRIRKLYTPKNKMWE